MTQNKLNLLLHCRGERVERDELKTLATPPANGAHCPIPHTALVESLDKSMQAAGMTIVQQDHGISHDGNRYFGMMQVVGDGLNADDYGLVVGLRNSHDKSCAAGLALGSGVFVCDNLAFSGEVKLARKHTRFIMNDLAAIVAKGVGQLGSYREHQERRIVAYREHEMTDVEVHDTVVRAVIDHKVCAPKYIPKVLQEWRTPSHPEFKPRTLWSLFNAFTEFMKGNGARNLGQTQKLHGVADLTCNLTASTATTA